MFEGFFDAYFAGIERCQLRYDHQHAENPGFTEWYQNEHYSNTALCWLSEVGDKIYLKDLRSRTSSTKRAASLCFSSVLLS